MRLRLLFFVCSAVVSMGMANAASTEHVITRGITAVLEETLLACNAENLVKLQATMKAEMPNRELVIVDMKREWALSDHYIRLVHLEELKHSSGPHANSRSPYATPRVVEMSLDGESKGDEPRSDFACRMVLSQCCPKGGVRDSLEKRWW